MSENYSDTSSWLGDVDTFSDLELNGAEDLLSDCSENIFSGLNPDVPPGNSFLSVTNSRRNNTTLKRNAVNTTETNRNNKHERRENEVTIRPYKRRAFHHSTENASMSKNAVLARQNRLKKKQYVNNLLKSVSNLTSENQELKNKCRIAEENVKELQDEVAYLRGIIENQTVLATLLQNIPGALRGSFNYHPEMDIEE